jgi:hypothetical protein
MDLSLAYLITFHTYGTWLPGDSRGSVDEKHAGFGMPYVSPAPKRHAKSMSCLKHAPVELDDRDRVIVLEAVREVFRHRRWSLHAAHVRTNHVHVVGAAQHTPERMMNDLKVWSTRRLVDAGSRPRGARVWVRHGSTR